jgi:hypothetical protein
MFVRDRQYAIAHGTTVAEIEKITWPLLNYRDHNGEPTQQIDIHRPRGKGDEYVIVCARHKSSGAQSLKTIMDYVSCLRITRDMLIDWESLPSCG